MRRRVAGKAGGLTCHEQGTLFFSVVSRQCCAFLQDMSQGNGKSESLLVSSIYCTAPFVAWMEKIGCKYRLLNICFFLYSEIKCNFSCNQLLRKKTGIKLFMVWIKFNIYK